MGTINVLEINMNLEEKLYRENIHIASIKSRIFAFLIDKILVSLIFSLIYWDNLLTQAENPYGLIALTSSLIWQLLLLNIAYEALFTFLYGATLGKILFKIRIIDLSLLDQPNLFNSILRAVFKTLAELIFYLSYCSILFSPLKQTLHDYLAKTIVVKNA